jgi:hypothetical protein
VKKVNKNVFRYKAKDNIFYSRVSKRKTAAGKEYADFEFVVRDGTYNFYGALLRTRPVVERNFLIEAVVGLNGEELLRYDFDAGSVRNPYVHSRIPRARNGDEFSVVLKDLNNRIRSYNFTVQFPA